jgi:hypothetical protein
MNEVIEALGRQIAELNEKRRSLMDEARKAREKELLEYEWLKDVEFTFEERMGGYGNTEWSLIFNSNYEPLKHILATSMILEGKEPGPPAYGCHSQCLTLARWEFGYRISTCNVDLFIDFVERIDAKIKMPSSLVDHLKIYKFLEGYCFVKRERYDSGSH